MKEKAVNGEVQAGGAVAAVAPPPPKSLRKVTDPREVEAVLLARMHQVMARKQELASAIEGVFDIARQLACSYRLQSEAIEKLTERVRTLEANECARCGAVQ